MVVVWCVFALSLLRVPRIQFSHRAQDNDKKMILHTRAKDIDIVRGYFYNDLVITQSKLKCDFIIFTWDGQIDNENISAMRKEKLHCFVF